MYYVDWSSDWDRSELVAVVILNDCDAAYCAIAFGVMIEDYDPVIKEFWYERSDRDDN